MLQVLMPTETWLAFYTLAEKAAVPVVIHMPEALGVGATRRSALRALHGNGRTNGHGGHIRMTVKDGAIGTGVTAQIRDVLAQHPGFTAAQIRDLFPNLKPTIVVSTLARLADSGTIKATGKRGRRRYWVAENRATA